MPTQLNGRWEQEQFDKWLPLKSASLSEQALKNEKRRIEQTTRARELFSKEICCNLVYRPAGVIPFTLPHPYFEKKLTNFFTNARRNSKRKKQKNRSKTGQGDTSMNQDENKTQVKHIDDVEKDKQINEKGDKVMKIFQGILTSFSRKMR